VITILLTSCSMFSPVGKISEEMVEPGRSQVVEIVWEALEPNTSSRERSNWQVVEVRSVSGESVAERFEGDPAPGCWSGPEPPENKAVRASKTYWYVLMVPTPATPEPYPGTPSPTAPPQIPEPFLREAHFLVDPRTNEIVARKLHCVIY
jgi:hypothetical protein